jgi:hypothetical protein
MARGNQREKAREKNQKALGAQKKKNGVSLIRAPASNRHLQEYLANLFSPLSPSQQSGTEFQRTKEEQANIMRAKQAAGIMPHSVLLDIWR